MPKLVIGKENFTDVDAYTGNVYVRYRLTSDDKNRSSYWSPVFEIIPPVYYVQGSLDIPGGIVGIKNSGYVTLAWDSVSIYSDADLTYWGELQSYDIWIQFGGNNMINAGPWIYKERVFTTSVNVIVPPSYNYVDANGATQTAVPRQMKVEIHRTVKPISRYSADRISFPQQSSVVNLTDNTITFPQPHGCETGDALGYYLYNAASAIAPLADGVVYWVRALSQNKITLHPTYQNAIDNTNTINLTSYGQGYGVMVKNPFLQSSAINTTTNVITLPYEHNFNVGDSVIYNALTAASPLVKETLYWARPVSPTQVTLHNTRASAIKNTNIIDLTTAGTGYATLPRFFSLFYKTSIINL